MTPGERGLKTGEAAGFQGWNAAFRVTNAWLMPNLTTGAVIRSFIAWLFFLLLWSGAGAVSDGAVVMLGANHGSLVAPAATPGQARQSYEWDAADRLVAMVRHLSPTETRRTEFLYNGEGSRVGKREFVNGTLQSDVRYLYDGTGVLQERSADGGTVLKTFTGGGEMDYTTSPPTPRFYTRDHLGSVREVLAEDGTLLARYDYKPYGERILIEGSYEAAKGYTGHDYLPEAGIVLTRYRGYDPVTGRWLSPDPLGEAGGMNLYGYVGGDPVNFLDPNSHFH